MARAVILRQQVGNEDEAVGEAAVRGSFSTKHFWLARMVARITSSGMPRKASSKLPMSTTGHSTRPQTSSRRPSSSTRSSPCTSARSRASAMMADLRRSRSTMTFAASSFAIQSVEPAHLDGLRRVEAVAIVDVGGGDALHLEAHDLGVLHLGPEGAGMEWSGRTQRSGARAPAHGFRPREAADDLGHDLGDHIPVARPGRSMMAT